MSKEFFTAAPIGWSVVLTYPPDPTPFALTYPLAGWTWNESVGEPDAAWYIDGSLATASGLRYEEPCALDILAPGQPLDEEAARVRAASQVRIRAYLEAQR